MFPAFKGVAPSSLIVIIGSFDCRSRIAPRWLARCGSRCWASTIGAGKSGRKVLTRTDNADTPPADDPTTTKSSGRSGCLVCDFDFGSPVAGEFFLVGK